MISKKDKAKDKKPPKLIKCTHCQKDNVESQQWFFKDKGAKFYQCKHCNKTWIR